jgi:putative transposase
MSMIHLFTLAVHLLATIAKLVRPGGVRAVVAESLLLKHQLVISSRARRRAPNLSSFDRFVFGLGSLFVPASRFGKLAVILKPRTLLRFHEALKKRKYRWLFSSGGHQRPGPKGPSKELIDAIVEFKRRNPRIGCPASHRRSRVPLASISTKTSSAACSRSTIDPKQEPMARLG